MRCRCMVRIGLEGGGGGDATAAVEEHTTETETGWLARSSAVEVEVEVVHDTGGAQGSHIHQPSCRPDTRHTYSTVESCYYPHPLSPPSLPTRAAPHAPTRAETQTNGPSQYPRLKPRLTPTHPGPSGPFERFITLRCFSALDGFSPTGGGEEQCSPILQQRGPNAQRSGGFGGWTGWGG